MTLAGKPRSLIINTPYLKPEQHWGDPQKDGSLPIVPERRKAGYEIFDTRNQTRQFIELEQVNKIRKRVDDWREAGYPGVTSVTRRLLEHWHDPDQRDLQFYYCQLEAIETLIWWVEAQASFKQGIVLQGDGGLWERLCNKMATGTGKTTVMAMIITWQVLNAVTFPKRKEFSRAVFIVTPGITVKERLQVLYPGHSRNYYD
jgi:type III restriction enzyme